MQRLFNEWTAHNSQHTKAMNEWTGLYFENEAMFGFVLQLLPDASWDWTADVQNNIVCPRHWHSNTDSRWQQNSKNQIDFQAWTVVIPLHAKSQSRLLFWKVPSEVLKWKYELQIRSRRINTWKIFIQHCTFNTLLSCSCVFWLENGHLL